MKRIGKICVLGLLLLSAVGCSKKDTEEESMLSSRETNMQSEQIAEAVTAVIETEETETSLRTETVSKIEETEQVQSETNEAVSDEKSGNAKQVYLESIQYAHDLEKIIAETEKQQEMNQRSGEALAAWDYELNRIYGLLKDILSSEQMEGLTIEELAWITERDFKVEEAGQEVAGGSLEAYARNMTALILTKERTLELINIYFGEITSQENNIAERTRDYIMTGQDGKSEAEKYKWSETFLNAVDIDAVYQQYLWAAGSIYNIEHFAKYLTSFAPIPDNWKTLIETDLFNTYGEEITRFEYLEDDLYQVYIQKDGSEIPYVTVSSRTGYFHG